MADLFSQWTASSVVKMVISLLLIIILALVSLYLVRLASAAIDRRFILTIEDPNRRARMHTLRKAAKSTLQITIIALAVLISLGTLGIDIGPALAAAGILGLAVSLGAQTLIKDMIGGLTVLLEDQYRVGDRVRIGSVIGEVEGITLRRTDVRDAEGRLYIVPNGEVRVVANETRNWSRALVELSFGLSQDLDKPMVALQKALDRLTADESVKSSLLAEPEIFRWDELKGNAVVVRLAVKVVAGKQSGVARLMRQYAIEELREGGVVVNNPSG